MHLRHTLLVLLAIVAAPVFAQSQDGAQPLPAVPPPPPEMAPFDAALEPQVTIRQRGEDTVEEFRVSGRLYMIKVTPPHGVPYYLVDNQGDGNFSSMDTMGSRLSVPRWVIRSW